MGSIAAYDAIADWYAEYVGGTASPFTERVHRMPRELLPHGTAGTCVDICCGTGAHSHVLAELGWSPVGVDLSVGQLRHAAAKLPVACADAAALPLDSGLTLTRVLEAGPELAVPDILGFSARLTSELDIGTVSS